MKKTKGESRSPVRLEGQYGCIDLVENHPSIGQLSRLFVLEKLYTSAPAEETIQNEKDRVKDIGCGFGSAFRPMDIRYEQPSFLETIQNEKDRVKDIGCGFGSAFRPMDIRYEQPSFLETIQNEKDRVKDIGCGFGSAFRPMDIRYEQPSFLSDVYEEIGVTWFGSMEEQYSFTERKEDGSRTAVQIIIPGLEIPRWLTYQSLGNSVSIKLPTYWCGRWMGLALCASFNAISSPSSADEFSNPVKTFGLRARVIKARHDYSYPPFEIFFNVEFAPNHIWLLYLSRDDWLDGEYSKIDVVFETYSVNVWKCGLTLLHEQDMEEFHKTFAQYGGSYITTYEGWDGVHYEFENSLDPLL
uniref:C-JID domain-containing protein n=1 Tax=Fagus sylvatica TaxID=28930 RepID=A0A2N9EF67_FAGSY